jgi:hypothetical protein
MLTVTVSRHLQGIRDQRDSRDSVLLYWHDTHTPREEELADEDSSAQREQQDDDEKQNKHASSNRSADGGGTLYGEGS